MRPDRVEVNRSFYDDQYRRSWKGPFLYDVAAKRDIARHVLREAGFRDGGLEVLDIGFGYGSIIFMFDPSDSLTGVEISQRAIESARKKARRRGLKSAEFLACDGHGGLPFPDDRFDLVICSHVLEHVPDDRFLIMEIRRTMKPEGLAMINVPINEQHFEDPRHAGRYEVASLLALLDEEDFRVVASYEGDRLWNLFGWFFEREYHRSIPVVGFLMSAVINGFFSIIPFSVVRMIERLFLFRQKPRQFAVVCRKSIKRLAPVP